MPDPQNLKKRLCNPPAEQVAASGDPELQGMFIGAGRAVEMLDDPAQKRWFVEAVTKCEATYLEKRRSLAQACAAEMHAAFYRLLGEVGYSDGKSGKER
jgi:hypothetical protein